MFAMNNVYAAGVTKGCILSLVIIALEHSCLALGCWSETNEVRWVETSVQTSVNCVTPLATFITIGFISRSTVAACYWSQSIIVTITRD